MESPRSLAGNDNWLKEVHAIEVQPSDQGLTNLSREIRHLRQELEAHYEDSAQARRACDEYEEEIKILNQELSDLDSELLELEIKGKSDLSRRLLEDIKSSHVTVGSLSVGLARTTGEMEEQIMEVEAAETEIQESLRYMETDASSIVNSLSKIQEGFNDFMRILQQDSQIELGPTVQKQLKAIETATKSNSSRPTRPLGHISSLHRRSAADFASPDGDAWRRGPRRRGRVRVERPERKDRQEKFDRQERAADTASRNDDRRRRRRRQTQGGRNIIE